MATFLIRIALQYSRLGDLHADGALFVTMPSHAAHPRKGERKPPAPRAGLFSPTRFREFAVREFAFLGGVTAVALYIGALANGFAYDDLSVISNNEWVRHGAVLTQAFALPYWPSGALYRPLTSLSYGLDWALSGGRPLLFHAMNIAWYALDAVLVTRLALRWWPPLAAALAGLLFAVQPVHVEAVANVVGRAELLTGTALLTLALVASTPRPLSSARLVVIGLLSAAALYTKETGVVAPLIVWATVRLRQDATLVGTPNPRPQTPDRSSSRQTTAADVRRMTGAALLGIALPLMQRINVLGTVTGDSPHPAFTAASHAQSLALALATIARATWLLIVPHLPRIDYSPSTTALTHPDVALVSCGAVLVILACGVLVAHARRPSRWTWAAVFTIATFAPVSNLVVHTGVVLADRTLYGPSIGTSILLGAALAYGTTAAARIRIGHRARHLVQRSLTGAVAVAAAALVIVGIVDTLRTVGVWRDNQSVFTAMRDRSPNSYRGYYLLGVEARTLSAGTREPSLEAHRDFTSAISLFDGDPTLLYEAAVNALQLRDTSDALTWLAQSIDRDPRQRRPRTMLALLDLHRGETSAARELLRTGVALEPDQRAWRKMLDSLDRAAHTS
jgi:hypothetical protein